MSALIDRPGIISFAPGQPKLDPVKGRRPAREHGILEAQLAQRQPAARHQPFATGLVAWEGLLVEHHDPLSTLGGKQCGGGPGRPGANHRNVGVDTSIRPSASSQWRRLGARSEP